MIVDVGNAKTIVVLTIGPNDISALILLVGCEATKKSKGLQDALLRVIRPPNIRRFGIP